MDVVKPSFISSNHITDAKDDPHKTPGFEVMDGQASSGAEAIQLRRGSRELALIDGLPMVSADAGNIKWQFLPLDNISQVEKIKGASSVLYGHHTQWIINFDSRMLQHTRNKFLR
jgi:iron complex outermembrane receptor protein